MAYSGIHLAPTGHRWRKYRRMVWRESLASQDYAQEVQIRNTFDYGYTNRIKYIYHNKRVFKMKNDYHNVVSF